MQAGLRGTNYYNSTESTAKRSRQESRKALLAISEKENTPSEQMCVIDLTRNSGSDSAVSWMIQGTPLRTNWKYSNHGSLLNNVQAQSTPNFGRGETTLGSSGFSEMSSSMENGDKNKMVFISPECQLSANVVRRNERERNRVKFLNLGFEQLREVVPKEDGERLSKISTLKKAIWYIQHLDSVLSCDSTTSGSSGLEFFYSTGSPEECFHHQPSYSPPLSPSL